jgi:glycosyltransferase involved in cell wall biosynthesis
VACKCLCTMRMSEVTILLPTYLRPGQPDFIARALRSIAAQSYANYSLLVIENGHDEAAHRRYDGVRDIVPAKWLYYPGFGNVAQALQFGLAHAGPSDYLCVMEDDDEWHPEFLQEMVATWEAHPDGGLVYCHEREIDPEGNEVDWTGHPSGFDRALLFSGNWIHLPAQMWRFDQVMATGGFDVLTSWATDWDMALRMSAYGTQFVPRVLLTHYWHGSNTCLDLDLMAQPVRVIRAKMMLGYYDPIPRGVILEGSFSALHRAPPLAQRDEPNITVRWAAVWRRGLNHYLHWIAHELKTNGVGGLVRRGGEWIRWAISGKATR